MNLLTCTTLGECYRELLGSHLSSLTDFEWYVPGDLISQWMSITASDFEWLRSLSVLDLLHLASIVPLLVRAKLCGLDLTWDYLRNSSQTGLLSDIERNLPTSEPETTPSSYLESDH